MPAGLLTFLACGSVDDGKSTLIGRLLHDCRAVYDDQLEDVRRNSRGGLELAFVTDGLRAEREQGITIDVAYRQFSTPRRRFRIADAPGHEQYTRNMATGASTADLAVILIDARKGVLPQTHRHACIASLLGIRRAIVAVNKMDLAGYRAETFRQIRDCFLEFSSRLGMDVDCVPVSALAGDNVVRPSERMPWYEGQSLLGLLEAAESGSEARPGPFRLPVQYVIRCGDGVRVYAGRIASGRVRLEDELLLLPAGRTVRVEGIPAFDAELKESAAPLSVALRLSEQVDAGRGDMLVDPATSPSVTRRLRARLLWMSEKPLAVNHPYMLKHTTRQVCAEVIAVNSLLDPATLDETPAAALAMNDIGSVDIETHRTLFVDCYSANRVTGSFILIDPFSNMTVAAGMISAVLPHEPERPAVATSSAQRGFAIWLTGLSSAGKTTLGRALYERLWARGLRVEHLDGDAVRENLSKGLGFSKQDRDENIRRIAFVAQLLVRNGVIVIVSAISPYRETRDEARRMIGNFVEVYVNAPLEVCEARDRSGIYGKARAGLASHVTGVDDPYEPPPNAEVECLTDRETLAESAEKVLEYLYGRLISA